ncbi:MOSC domain-containing protein YiiM [Sphingomonas guangdongensis]|uniref:MOSC domain-containing protein YiiM n=1 Tax=Sphingomonas guangdongensis TaxID=1141890 RepID=A0A285QCX3_9SPHN|nr:MOSC domain-containing protein [Sphingomonas guangdongensis]SOB79790.1 MOSC domain-containing protein YiiM [Sphingomonas guangdongensis]
MSARLLAVYVGGVAALGPEKVPSAFVKSPVAGSVTVDLLGLAGDAQADLSVHGGPDKAVYGYPADRYAGWQAQFPALADALVPGALGENLAITGLVEDDLCVGDVHAVGTALLQVCQPRQPCFKLALKLGEPRAGRHMVRSGWSGWYYRVLRPGIVAAGDPVTIKEHGTFPFPRLVEIINRGGARPDELDTLAAAEGVAERLRRNAARERVLGSSRPLG